MRLRRLEGKWRRKPGRKLWCRVSRSMTVTAWREEKRRTVAHTEAASCSWVKMGLKLWELIDCDVASIPLFRIDIPLSSESIQFCAKMTRVEPDNKVELGEVLGLLCLPLGQYLGSRKILKILMICNNINGIGQTFQIMLPNLESFEDGKQFLVMCVIVQLCHSKSTRVKGNWMNFIIFVNNGEDCNKSIVQSIGNTMSEDRCEDKCFLERVESILTRGVKLLRNVLLGEVCQ